MADTQTNWNKGQNDAQNGKGPADTSGMSDAQKKAYDAGYKSGNGSK